MGNCVSSKQAGKKPRQQMTKEERQASMSIFQTQSAIVRIHGPDKVQQLQQKVVKSISDASKAVK